MQNIEPKAIYKNIQLVYGALLVGMLFFLVIASLLVSNSVLGKMTDPLMLQILKLLVIGFAVVLIPIAHGIPQRMIKKISPDLGLSEKMTKYQQALIIRFAATEIAAFFAIIIFMISGDTDLMFLIAIVLLYYLISRPNQFKVATDLELKELEKKELFNQ